MKLSSEAHSFQEIATLLQKASFRFRHMLEAQALAEFLGEACPNPRLAIMGISELLVNAIEHGNLGIGFEEKSKLQVSDGWLKEIERRLNLPENIHKFVEVEFTRYPTEIHITVKDSGLGFKPKPFEKIKTEQRLDKSGRGIALAKHLAFERLEYSEKGNSVTGVITL